MPDNEITPNSVPEWIKERLHRRSALGGELTALAGRDDEESRTRAEAVAAEYAALDPLPPEYAEIADKEFAAAQQRFRDGLTEAAQVREAMRAIREKLDAAVAGLTALNAEPSLLGKRREVENLCKTVRSVSGCDPVQEALGAKLADDLTARLQSETDRAQNAEQDLAKLREELTALQAAGDMEAYRKQQKKLEKRRDSAMGALGGGAAANPDADPVRDLFRKLNAALALHLQTLDLARWESYTLKLDLLRELEDLQTVTDDGLPAAAKRLREIRDRWKALGPVPHEKQQETGPQFYGSTTALQHRIDEYYKVVRAERSVAAEAKIRLCETAESLADSTDYSATAEKLKALQQEWKTAGHAGRDQEQKLYERFRAACDKFFAARNAWRDARNAERSAGEKTKRELCDEAAKLAGMPPREAVARARELRAAFQAAPRAGRAEEELRNCFNERMDQFFQALRAGADQAMQRREAILSELTSAADAERLHALREEWKTLPQVDRAHAGRLDARFRAAETEAERRLREEELKRRRAAAPFFPSAMREAVKCCAAAAAGGPLPEITLDLTPFPRLAAAVTDLTASGGTMPDDLTKAIARNTKEFRKLLTEWERLAPAGSGNGAPRDLAAELTAAIAGNFGGSSAAVVRSRPDGPRDLQRKLLAIGVIDPAEADALLARYEVLAAKL